MTENKILNFIYEIRNSPRLKEPNLQILVLVNIKTSVFKKNNLVLSSKNISENGLFLNISKNKHVHKVGDILELGFVENNKNIIKGGVVRRIEPDGIGVEVLEIEEIVLY